MSRQRTVLITGATGFIGGHVTRACIGRGWKVRAFALPGDEGAHALTEQGVTVCFGDIADPDAVLKAAEGTDLIFHCAGMVTDWAAEELFRKVMVIGTENVCRAALTVNARLVHVSTNDVFGRDEDVVMTEDLPLQPWGEPYPDFKIEAERVVWRYHREKGLRASMVYPCWVYGPGDRTFVPLLADAIIKKEMIFWRKDVLVWPTYVANLVDLMMTIAVREEAVGEGFIAHDGESTTLQEFCARIANAMNVPVPHLRIPYPVAYLAALCMEAIWKIGKFKSRPLLTTYAVRNLGSWLRFSISKADRMLGWKPAITHQQGMAVTLDWLKQLDHETFKQK